MNAIDELVKAASEDRERRRKLNLQGPETELTASMLEELSRPMTDAESWWLDDPAHVVVMPASERRR